MPESKGSNLITDQEIAFAHLVLSGTMNDRDAAQAAGLNPDTAAYTKAKPCVRTFMLDHRAAVQQPLLEQESDGKSRLNLRREQVLDRLWELAALGPEITRGSITGQVKAISMIVAIEGLIPDRRANSAAKQSAPPLPEPDIYKAAWLRRQEGETIEPQPDQHGVVEPEATPNFTENAPPPSETMAGPIFDPSESAFANRFSSPGISWAPNAVDPAPDNRVPFSIQKGRFGRR